MIRLLPRPVPEGRAETVRHGRNPVLAEQAAQLLVVERLPARAGEHQWTGSPASNSPLTEEKGRNRYKSNRNKELCCEKPTGSQYFPYTREREIQ